MRLQPIAKHQIDGNREAAQSDAKECRSCGHVDVFNMDTQFRSSSADGHLCKACPTTVRHRSVRPDVFLFLLKRKRRKQISVAVINLVKAAKPYPTCGSRWRASPPPMAEARQILLHCDDHEAAGQRTEDSAEPLGAAGKIAVGAPPPAPNWTTSRGYSLVCRPQSHAAAAQTLAFRRRQTELC